MESYIDKDINPHNFDEIVSKGTQEGTRLSPPVITIENEEGILVAYVTLDCYNDLKRNCKKTIEEVKNECNIMLQEKDNRYHELETKFKLATKRSAVANPKELYLYDPIMFPDNVNGDKVVDALVNLLNLKVGEKLLISKKRDWVIAWRILKWHNLLSKQSNLSDFCRLVNEVVLQHLEDEERKRRIICDINNFTSIRKEDFPPYRFDPPKWLINYMYDPKGCKSLKRALQITKALNHYLNFE